MKYEVFIDALVSYTMQVEASSEEEAIEIANNSDHHSAHLNYIGQWEAWEAQEIEEGE